MGCMTVMEAAAAQQLAVQALVQSWFTLLLTCWCQPMVLRPLGAHCLRSCTCVLGTHKPAGHDGRVVHYAHAITCAIPV